MDTRDKRGSAIGLALGFLLILPNPDGLALDQGDRQQTAHSYRGIAAANPVPVTVVPGDYVATYQRTANDTATYQSAADYTATYGA